MGATFVIAQLSPAILPESSSLTDQAAVSLGAAALQGLLSLYLYSLKAKQPSPAVTRRSIGIGIGAAAIAIASQLLLTAALSSTGSDGGSTSSAAQGDRLLLGDASAAVPALLAAAFVAPLSEELVSLKALTRCMTLF